MFDIGWSEILVIGIVALVVIGPKDLPKALSTLGKWVARARAMAREFQNNVDDMVRQAELEELRQQVQKARDFNLTTELENSIDPDGGMRKTLAVEDFTSPAGQPDAPGEPVAQPKPASLQVGNAAPDVTTMADTNAEPISLPAVPAEPTAPTKDVTP